MKILYYLFLFLFPAFTPSWSQEVYQAHTHLRLVSEQDAAAPGTKFWVALDFRLDDGWHIYWRNPGDSGLAPKVHWDLPSGLTAGDIQWPYPQRINAGPLTSYGYEHEVFLLIPLEIDSHLSLAGNILLSAKLDWLACKDICIPGKAQLHSALPIALNPSNVPFNAFKSSFDETRQNLPQELPSINSSFVQESNHWRLNIQAPASKQGDIVFYPFRDDVIEHPATQEIKKTKDGFQLILTKSHIFQGTLASLDGIAVNPAGWEGNDKLKAITIKALVVKEAAQISFWFACLFAFIGGLILNLMPCVLPVLSIKVLHLVERHPDRKIALFHSIIYALGILISVWALAGLLFILKAAGQFAGWGFQFQSPVFVICVAVILFVLALNLFGVFEFTIPSICGLPVEQAGFQASFISGVVTTIVASPCTAPFMGTALTVAISQPGIIGFGIFTFLGLGLASPFILLSAFPSLLSFVPKPGLWMINLKKGLGIVLMACVIWLLWVFGLQTGLGDISKFFKSSHEIQWQGYSSTAVNQARQTGHGVFIDFTAAWCINCQVNDRLVLQNPQVIQVFKDKGIIAFKGDWTKYDPAITQALASFGRESIPVYVYFAPGADTPILLPQIITPKIILEKLK